MFSPSNHIFNTPPKVGTHESHIVKLVEKGQKIMTIAKEFKNPGESQPHIKYK